MQLEKMKMESLLVLNLLSHHRSKPKGYMTAMILRNRDISYFKVNQVYKRFVNDLNDIIGELIYTCRVITDKRTDVCFLKFLWTKN